MEVHYIPRPLESFYVDWKNIIYNNSSLNTLIIDKYEHFNDFLSNEFTESCQFGTLKIELNKVKIP